MKNFRVPLLFLTALSVAAQAEEGKTWDLRLSVGTAPGISKDVTSNSTTATGVADPSNNTTESLNAVYGIDVQVGARWRRAFSNGFGIVAGPDLFFRSVSGTLPDSAGLGGVSGEETLSAFGVRMVAGPTFTVRDRVRFELTPFLEGGGATNKVDLTTAGNTESTTSDVGSYFGYGITAGAFYLINKQFQIGVQAGYQGFTSQVKYKSSAISDNQTDTLTGSGFIGNVSTIWSF